MKNDHRAEEHVARDDERLAVHASLANADAKRLTELVRAMLGRTIPATQGSSSERAVSQPRR
jgi:hypothetical protein